MDDKLEIYTKGTKAWFRDKEEAYVSATMATKEISDKIIKMEFILDATQKSIVYQETIANLTKTNFDDLPPLKNPPHLEATDDLTNLSHLHEAGVLNSVRQRYFQENIYTYSGLVLIAMNPFRRLDIYTPEIMKQYCGRPRTELEPHLFAIAEEAYRRMTNLGDNQSIIVSGESGAGKTMSAKFVMRYFAVVEELANGPSQKKSNSDGEQTSVEEAVLSTNPIMEAFGNAKTTRNDNSSRFGKYIEILFDRTPKSHGVVISGARIRTYLLERSRLTFQPESERNYHIFYQLCAATPAAERKQLGIENWDHFFYLRQGKTGTVKGMDDVEEFAITQKGMSTVGISVSSQWEIFKICAAVLHIGNIVVIDNGGNADIKDDDPALVKSSELLGVDAAQFKHWLIKRQIVTRSEKIMSNAKPYQAVTSRDSIAKFIYSMLFDWIVKIVNVKLNPANSSGKEKFIGVLDIYGFEHFQKNSFEQFCINFANEKLQQEFTRHVFRLEQEEYVAEKIAWSFINFSDNQPCIDMIEGKLGILDLLDEESRLPNGQDKSLILKLYTRYGPDEHKFFAKPRFGEKEFVVKHYAIDVTYQIEGFIDKNKDTVSDEQLEMLNNSTFEFFKEVIHLESESDSSAGKGLIRKPKKPTLGSIFKGSLIKLMETLRQTNPHYIRCIKPNQSKVAFEFEAQNVLGQLIACGVLETIKISRAGYPSKQLYNDFVNRYYLLVSSKQWSTEPRKLTESICKETIKGEGKFELGLTKVFFRAGQLAYLEKMRSIRLTSAVIVLQKNFIRVYHQKRYKKTIAAAKLVQEAWKNYMFVREKKLHKKKYAAITIQSNFRGYSARKKYGSARSLQKAREEKLAKKKAEEDALKAKLAEAERVAELARLKREAGAAKAAEEAEKARLERLAEAQKMAEASRAAEIAAKTQPLLEKNEALETLIKTKDEQIAPLLAENERLHSLVLTKTEEMNPLIEENEKLKIRLTQKEDTLTPMVAENLGLQKTMDEKDAQLELLKKENLRLDSLVRKRDDEITGFLEREKESIESIMQFKQTLQSRPKRDDAETASLKKELNSLREQLNRLVVGKYRSDANTAQFFETDQPIARRSNPLTMQSMNRMSMQMYESASQRVSQSLGRVESVDSKPFKVRPIEIDDDSAVPQDKATRMLQDPELQDEIADNLITGLRIPEPRSRKTPSRREIFFPAHMLGCVLSEFLQHQMVDAMRETFGIVVKTISNVTAKYNDDFQSAFWLTNNFELLGVIKTARINYPKPAESNQNDESSVMANLAGIDSDIRALMVDIYDGWLKAHRQTLTTMIVPAVIENQSLSGYVCKKSGGLWSQWTTVTSSNVKCSIEQLIEHLFKISAIMKYYFFEESIQRQFLTELIRTIGVTSFNHLLTRANFSTWKRGVQIEHNVTLLENWCNSEGLSQAGVYLQQLMQASKLLTLKKSSVSDVNTIYEKCFLLNPTQIKKLLAGYTADDFDSPLSSEVFNEVIMRSRKTEHQANAVDYTPEFVFPEPRDIQNIEKYIPPTAKVPFLQAVTLFEK